MRIEFEGQAAYDERKNCVLFAGRYRGLNADKAFVCSVTRQALSALAGRTDELPPEEMLKTYLTHANAINLMASAKYRQGDMRPVVDVTDLTKNR